MKSKKILRTHPVIENVRKIMIDRKLTQAAAAECAGTSASQFSKILNGEVQMSLWQLSNFASNIGMEIIDVFTYPDKYIKADVKRGEDSVEAVLQIKLRKDKKEEVLKLIFGDSNLEILNK